MKRSRKTGWARPFLLLFGLFGLAAPLAAQGADCTSCHDQGQKLAKSAHAPVACASCHVKHEEFPHPEGIPKPVCTTCHASQARDYEVGVHGQAAKKGGAAPDCNLCHGSAHELISPKSQTFRTAVPDTCNMCHGDVVEQYRSSVHGQALAKGIMQAPLCTDCHGEHAILPPTDTRSSVSAGHVRDTCGNCHGNVQLARRFGLPADRLVTFDASFHGLAEKSGNQTVANCSSCHGVHNILPSSDPKSMVNARHLAETCGKCHQGAGQRFSISPVHVVEGRTEPSAVRWTRQFYLLIIPLTLGLMLIHNGGDWVRKLLKLRAGTAIRHHVETEEYTPEVRMLSFERVQHALLVVSFVALVWTGFALKYPDQWWARPLLWGEGSHPLRGLVHRIAAVVFISVAVTHLLSLILNRRLRDHWKEMAPKLSDATEALANLSYNVGIRSQPPGRSSHSYIEKAEYWAVVWGAAVMAGSGIMLWANNLMLKLLPKTWLDVATTVHFYEAVLATLAIVIWHFYSVIFDPDVYPMDTAWYTGVSVRKHEVTAPSEAPQDDADDSEKRPVDRSPVEL